MIDGNVEKQLPVKQGLWRFYPFLDNYDFLLVEKQLPVKQGLWLHEVFLGIFNFIIVEKQLPVKQGLWPSPIRYKSSSDKISWKTTSSKTKIMTPLGARVCHCHYHVEKQLPVKQGLWLLFLPL